MLIYNAQTGTMKEQQPYPSWVLDSNGKWTAPIPHPQDGLRHAWIELTQTWGEGF